MINLNPALNPIGQIARVQYQPNEDPHIRIRIAAELMEVFDELNQCDLTVPVTSSIAVWYQQFHGSLRHHDIAEVINRFVTALEDLLADPVDHVNPYPAGVFGAGVPRIVRFMIAKMIDRDSLFFSEKINAAAPPPMPVIIIPQGIEAQIQRINAINAQRHQQELQGMQGLFAQRNRIHQIHQQQQHRIINFQNRFHANIAELQGEIEVQRRDIREDRNHLMVVAERLGQEVVVLRREVDELREQVLDVRNGINEVQKANAELQIAINEVAIAVKEKKENWINNALGVIASIAISIALNYWIPGAQAVLSKGMLEATIPLPL